MSSSRFALCLALLFTALPSVAAADTVLDSRIGNTAPYLTKDRGAEIALARSAAPSYVSADAAVYLLGTHGYEKVADGTNGWVCMVGHSFDAFFNDTEFWLPENRSPVCLNPPAVATVLPFFVQRSKWVMAGDSIGEMIAKTKAAVGDGTFKDPAPGSFSLMMSKHGYLNHAHGPWHPHVMFFVASHDIKDWGASDVQGTPALGTAVLSAENGPFEPALTFIVVKRWSDGSLDIPPPSTSMAPETMPM